MFTTRADGLIIPSGLGPDGSGTARSGDGEIPSGFGPTPSGTARAGGPDITSGYGPSPASAGISLNIGDSIVLNTVTYKYEGVISKSTLEAEIFLLAHNGSKCVFKFYYANFKPKEDIVKRLKQLKHEDIINVIDYGYYHDRFFEIMDYAEGGTLEKHLPIKNIPRFKIIIAETVNAYKFCHANGIIHKDIKPQNLYCKNADGTDIVIGDFGISSSLEGGMSRHLTSQSFTVGYAAPEMYGIGGKVYVGKEVDYYALGITLIHIWDGVSPFDNLSIHSIANLTTSGKVRIPEDMPKNVQNLVKGLITVDYTKRWGYEEIQRWLKGEDVPVHFQIQEVSYPPLHFSPTEEATTIEELVSILKKNSSDIGKKRIYSGKVSAWVNVFDHGLAAELDRVFEDDYPTDQEAGLQKTIYLLNPDEPFVQNGKVCRKAEELADALEEDFAYYLTELGKPNHRFYLYLEAHDEKKEADTFRKYFKTFSAKKALNTIILELRGRGSFKLGNELFFTPEELLKYKDQQFLVSELKDRESRPSLWIDGTSFHEIKEQLEAWRGLKKCDETTLAYVSATGNGVPQIEISKASFSFSDLRIGTSVPDSFTINNRGGGVLSGSITTDKKWLKVSQSNIDKSQRKQHIKFSIDTVGLPFGSKETGKIVIQSNVGVEIVEIDISIELGVKAAARFRTGMTIGAGALGALFGFVMHKVGSILLITDPSYVAGLTGIIGLSFLLATMTKRLQRSPLKIALVTLIVGLLFFGFLSFNWPLAYSVSSWALVLALIAFGASPSILRSLQIGNKTVAFAVGIGTMAFCAAILFADLEITNRISASAPQATSTDLVSGKSRDRLTRGEPSVADSVNARILRVVDSVRSALSRSPRLEAVRQEVTATAASPVAESAAVARPQASEPSDAGTSIRFINDSADGSSVNIFWVDFRGDESLYNTLASNSSYEQPTYVNHRWIARNARTGAVLFEGAATEQPSVVNVAKGTQAVTQPVENSREALVIESQRKYLQESDARQRYEQAQAEAKRVFGQAQGEAQAKYQQAQASVQALNQQMEPKVAAIYQKEQAEAQAKYEQAQASVQARYQQMKSEAAASYQKAQMEARAVSTQAQTEAHKRYQIERAAGPRPAEDPELEVPNIASAPQSDSTMNSQMPQDRQFSDGNPGDSAIPAQAQAVSPVGMARDARSGCFVWKPSLQPNEAVRWTGACANSLAEGQGKAEWLAGGAPTLMYEGTFRGGMMQGFGRMSAAGGDRYEGEYRDGKRDGRGTYIAASGERYDGSWKDNHRNGQGILVRTDGSRIEGQFRDGDPVAR